MKKGGKKIVFGLLRTSKFIMRYLSGLARLHKLWMRFLKGIMETCGNPSQLFLHTCGRVTLSWMHHCQWDKTSACSGIFCWPVVHLQMCEGHMCDHMSMSCQISNRLFLPDQMDKPLHGVIWIRVVNGMSFCVLVFTDNHRWLLKYYLFVISL